MPQFDPNTMPTQLFWLIVSFGVLYLILWRVVLPRIATVLEARQDKLEDDLVRAEKLKSEAEDVLADYEKSLAEARDQAQSNLKAAHDAMAAETAKKIEELNAELAQKTTAAEKRIAEAKDAALASIKAVAADSAVLATSRLIGVEVPKDQAENAVDQALKGSG